MSKTRSRRDRQRPLSEASAHCPACSTEYVAGVATCADCGTALVTGPAPAVSFAIPFSDDLVVLTETEQARVLELADDLAMGELPHHARPLSLAVSSPTVDFVAGVNPTWEVLVRPADLDRAQAYIHAVDAPLAMSRDEVDAAIAGGHPMREMLVSFGGVFRWIGVLTLVAALGTYVFEWVGIAGDVGDVGLVLAFIGGLIGFVGLGLKREALLPDTEAPEDGT